MAKGTVKVTVTLPAELVAAIDRARGFEPRSSYIGRLLAGRGAEAK